MFRQLITISRNTFIEAIRQPVFTVLLMTGVLGLVLNVFTAAYSMEPGEGDNKVLVDMGLSMVMLVCLLLAAFTATGVLSDEIESKTVLTVVSKPVARPTFVLGKFLGIGAAIALAYWVLAVAFFLSLRHQVLQNASDRLDVPVLAFGFGFALIALLVSLGSNYLYRRPFTSTFVVLLAIGQLFALLGVLVVGKGWVLQSPLEEFFVDDGKNVQIVVGLGLIFQAVLVLTAVAVTVSTRLGQLMTLLICIGVFFAGLASNSLSGWVNQRLGLPHDVGVYQSIGAIFTADIGWGLALAYFASKVVYLVLPNLQFFWPADAISQGNSMIHDLGGNFTLVPVLSVTLYAALYLLVLVCLATALFQRREVG
ncbi:MAG: ABC transporter permease subunit [Planctomycetota bacterium]